ncbi:hypothetical protein [Qingshengfaniella alkalisoli]|uniref:hypothetical protein n=1 Tax=Qingshengfaniella alkalisoli TaxID=2599296 RepID=UPI0030844619
MKYGQEFNGIEVQGGIGFSRRDGEDGDTDDTFGSVAVKFQSGFNIAFSAGSRENDGQYGYGKLGYDRDLVNWGQTSFGVDYYQGTDFVSDGSTSEVLGIGISQDFDEANTQIYLAYRAYQFDEDDTSYEDANALLFGMRVKF